MTSPLRGHRAFRRFWAGQAVSQFGDRVSELALPLIAVGALDASTAQVAGLTAALWAPNLAAVFLGAWVDGRPDQRRLLVLADLVRAAALATLPVAALFGAVTLGQLYAVAVVTGAAGVLFGNAYAPFFARLVPRSAYLAANSRLSGTRSAAQLAGPALGGALVQALTAPVAVLADAVSFLVSALLVGGVRTDRPPTDGADGPDGADGADGPDGADGADGPDGADGAVLRRAREGLGFVLRHPYLRASLGCCTTVNFFTFLGYGLTVLFAGRELGLSAGRIGLAFGLGATGGLLGALGAPALSRRIGAGRTIVLGAVLFPAPIALLAVAGGPVWARTGVLAAAEFLSGLGVMLFDVPLNAVQAAVVPDRLRSRVSGAFATVNYGVRPLGALLGGLLGTVLGLRPALLVAALGGSLAVLWLLPSPVPGVRAPESLVPLDLPLPSGGGRDGAVRAAR
ncbi:MFS transporter [Kitasatospora cineracea]|uniref:MFS family arabinose efflux permease n=1 Tax=Kitasatospora cineracea TaxID=88074 RepID=A0A3N4RQQ5_9ACTN|nr:MFS transporter [Kitasatospora cineracea]RPE26394.1 putative MFS family arabinose efflux permease [Kitasatospora cineracea]